MSSHDSSIPIPLAIFSVHLRYPGNRDRGNLAPAQLWLVVARRTLCTTTWGRSRRGRRILAGSHRYRTMVAVFPRPRARQTWVWMTMTGDRRRYRRVRSTHSRRCFRRCVGRQTRLIVSFVEDGRGKNLFLCMCSWSVGTILANICSIDFSFVHIHPPTQLSPFPPYPHFLYRIEAS